MTTMLNLVTLMHVVFRNTTMFFVGAGIGIVMNHLFSSLYERWGSSNELGLSILQLLLIAALISYFSAEVQSMGLFISGLLMAQELYITRFLPQKRKTTD
jgi:hypothetical protein